MNNVDGIKICQNIWEKIDLPSSAYPDIAKCQVLEIIIDELCRQNILSEDTIENWVLNYLSLVSKADKTSLFFLWQDKVPRYYNNGRKDEFGCPLAIPFEEYDEMCQKNEDQMSKAIDSLIAKKKIIEELIDDRKKLKLNKEEE